MSAKLLTTTCALVLTLLLGCEPPRVLGDQCDLNTHCDYPLVCHHVRCRRQCDTVRDCPIGALCVPTNQGYGVCLLPDEMGCAHDSDCAGELVCFDGRCGNACTDDADCAAGARCEGEEVGTRACVDPNVRECQHDSQCPDGLSCLDGRCAIECVEDRDCRDGLQCVEGACRPFDAGAPSPTDAGVAMDAGSMSVDAGPAVIAVCSVASDCRAPGVTESDCVGSRCVATSCEGSLADCNTTYEDGCEVDTQSDPHHCGGCGGFCGYGYGCVGSSCTGEVVDIDLGEFHLCAAISTGKVACMGENQHGQIGNGFASNDLVSEPEPAHGLSDAVAVAAGLRFTCALRSTGEVMCWGTGRSGQIGEGRYTDRHTPRAVHTVTDATQLEVGLGFACARTSSGTVWCWGDNQRGQLGDGTFETRNEPVQVAGLSDATDIALGYRHACAVRATGAIECWGSDASGALGEGAGSPETCNPSGTAYPCSTTPVLVSGITDAVDVEAGGDTSFARHADGSISVWGRNHYGNFGVGEDPTTTPSADTPRAVPTLTNVEQLAVGVWHSCARHTDGTVSCWGDSGALGDGTGGSSTSPVTVLGLSDALDITVDVTRSCALRDSGGPVCWGYSDGSFGADGPSASWTSPMPISSSFP